MLSTHPWSSAWRPEQAPLELCTEFVAPLEAFLAHAFARLDRARRLGLRFRFLRRVRRRPVRGLGCRLSGSTPSRTVGRSRTPLDQLLPVRRSHAIRLGS